ncbi:hypothetical protein CCC_00793 [Paramagnetospirillum magnetotacticum MS-1]|uniref:Glycosyltransferase RgtA/B/C/D-like domain-containing protein n=1 Tax=Paramagnetospirillum magnetotacticum MS-1 TaxID=272627 RepID=A0A0C2U8A7_PARME|nr:hypothetical protein [Paramagnetospirillum magnetotacticum]KIL97732.1 hypothetical protein CCC_00793 [Paramagnetospirillum magnetotacticum MS-1]
MREPQDHQAPGLAARLCGRQSVVDVAVIAALLAAMALTPFFLDEGWQLYMLIHSFAKHRFSLGFHLGDLEITFMKPLMWVHAQIYPLTRQGALYVLLRLPSTLMAVAAWWFLSRSVLMLGLGRPAAMAATALLFVMLAASYMVWARFDVIYVLAETAVIYAALAVLLRQDARPLLLVTGLVPLLMPNHHMVVAAVLVYVIALIFVLPRLDRRTIALGIAIGAVATAIGLRLLIWNLSPSEFLALQRHWSEIDVEHSRGIAYELNRYWFLFRTNPLFFWSLLAMAGAALLPGTRAALPAPARRFLLVVPATLALMLLFYPSKWPVYTSVYFPPLILLTAAALCHYARQASAVVAALAMLVLIQESVLAKSVFGQSNAFMQAVQTVTGANTPYRAQMERIRTMTAGHTVLMPPTLMVLFPQTVMYDMDIPDTNADFVIWNVDENASAPGRHQVMLEAGRTVVEIFKFQGDYYAVYKKAGL